MYRRKPIEIYQIIMSAGESGTVPKLVVIVVFKVICKARRLPFDHGRVRSSMEFLHRVVMVIEMRTWTEDLPVVEIVDDDLERFPLVVYPLFRHILGIIFVVRFLTMVQWKLSVSVHYVRTFPTIVFGFLGFLGFLDDYVLGIIIIIVIVVIIVIFLDDDSFLLFLRFPRFNIRD